MKKAVILGERQAGLIEVPDPQPLKDWVVVKVEASALCTEYKSYLVGRELQLGGHEGVGEVVAVAQARLSEDRRSGGYPAPITMREMCFVQRRRLCLLRE